MRFIILSISFGVAALGCTSDDASIAQGSPDASATTDGGGQNGASAGSSNGGSGNGGQQADASHPGTAEAGAGLADSGARVGDAGTIASDSGVTTDGGEANCGTGQICFTIDGDAIAALGGGYTINEVGLGDYVFVKYELGAVQLSIDVFSLDPGTYDVSEAREAGKARVYYFDGNGGEFMSSSGTVEITEIGDGSVTGTFSATLEEFDANTQSFAGGPTLEVADGTFVEIGIPSL